MFKSRLDVASVYYTAPDCRVPCENLESLQRAVRVVDE
jgi:hypothetical protein